MNRRRFLAACAAAGLAGCSGEPATTPTGDGANTRSPTDASTPASTPESTEMPTSTPESTETAGPGSTDQSTPTGQADLVVEASSLERASDDAPVYAQTRLTNRGSAASGTVSLLVHFYSANGNLVENARTQLAYLPAGSTWEAVVPYGGGKPSVVDSHDASVDFDATAPAFAPAGVRLLDSELRRGERETTVAGRVRNDRPGELPYLAANVLFVADDSTVLGSGTERVTGLSSGDTWAFETSWPAGPHPTAVQRHEVRLTTSR